MIENESNNSIEPSSPKEPISPPESSAPTRLVHRLVRQYTPFGINFAYIVALIYLACTSRKLRNPISVLISGSAGAGKSFAMRMGLDLIPEAERVELSFLSPAVFRRFESLKGKILVRRESVLNRELESALRQFYSDGEVRQKLVCRGEVREFVVSGPAPVIESTTEPQKIDYQNLTRVFSVRLEMSPQDLERNLSLIKKRWTHSHDDFQEKLDEFIKENHALQASLDAEVDVEISFADLIELTIKLTHEDECVHRVVENVLRLVACVAFADQHNRQILRKQSGKKYIQATVDDYADAYDILQHVTPDCGTETMPTQAAQLFSVLKKDASLVSTDEGFSRAEVTTRHPEWTQKKVRTYISYLVDADLLLRFRGPKNKALYLFPESVRQATLRISIATCYYP